CISRILPSIVVIPETGRRKGRPSPPSAGPNEFATNAARCSASNRRERKRREPHYFFPSLSIRSPLPRLCGGEGTVRARMSAVSSATTHVSSPAFLSSLPRRRSTTSPRVASHFLYREAVRQVSPRSRVFERTLGK